MSIRAGIAALNKRLEEIKSDAFSMLGFCEVMRRERAKLQAMEAAGEELPRWPSTEEEAHTRLAALEPDSLAYKMISQQLHNLRREAPERGAA